MYCCIACICVRGLGARNQIPALYASVSSPSLFWKGYIEGSIMFLYYILSFSRSSNNFQITWVIANGIREFNSRLKIGTNKTQDSFIGLCKIKSVNFEVSKEDTLGDLIYHLGGYRFLLISGSSTFYALLITMRHSIDQFTISFQLTMYLLYLSYFQLPNNQKYCNVPKIENII